MHTAIYHWKIKIGFEKAFEDYWKEGTLLFIKEQSSWGSRLHKANDGSYFAYAQWPTRELYESKKTLSPSHRLNLSKMFECIETSFETVVGDVICDCLIHRTDSSI